MSFLTYLAHTDVLSTIITFETLLISGLVFFKWLSKKHLDDDPIKTHYLSLIFLLCQFIGISLLILCYNTNI